MVAARSTAALVALAVYALLTLLGTVATYTELAALADREARGQQGVPHPPSLLSRLATW